MNWTKQSTRGTGAAQILDSDDGFRLVKGKGWNSFWSAFRIEDGMRLRLESGLNCNLRQAKADILHGRYTVTDFNPQRLART